ncbi:MAG: diguanylate cyclase [Actinomycetota bacterium]|jgi:signal transduction histidine kinase|nr:diguanylate cyclase [Actinomycetota bacterium]
MALQRIRPLLPEGGGLPAEVWDLRHKGLVALVAFNAVGLAVFGVVQGYGLTHSLLEASIVAVAAILAWLTRDNRLVASVICTLGLMSASAILVHLSRGSIEAHFHFFVMVTIIILYQEWVPFLLSIVYVVAHHAFFGLADPSSVFNHQAALNNPVKWAAIHGLFILGATVAGLTVWKQNEALRNSYQSAARQLAQAETRQREALDLNDNVLQNLAAAEYAFELNLPERGRDALKKSLEETQKIVTELLKASHGEVVAGDLIRRDRQTSEVTS